MQRTNERSAARRIASWRGAGAALLATGVIVAAVTFGPSGRGSKAVANGGSSGASLPAKTVKTLVFGGEILSGQDTTSLPITQPFPPVEAVSTYKVPSNMRLVIESAYADINEQFGEYRRSAFSALVSSSYDLPACAHPGFERDYGLALEPPVVTDHEVALTGSLSGPIYVEGGRTVAGSVFAWGADSSVVGLITVHGYLEPGVNPTNPKPTTEC